MRQMVADGTHLSNGHIEPTRNRGCKCKYRIRWFYSKGAFLVLTWNLLVSLTCRSLTQLQLEYRPSKLTGSYSLLLFDIPVAMLVVAVPLSGWLADAKFGNYRVSKVALVLLFLGTVMNCVLVLILKAFPTYIYNVVLRYVLFYLVFSLIGVGGSTYCVLSLQLGLDQMPDASAFNITSFIAWCVFSYTSGLWVTDSLRRVLVHCVQPDRYLFSNFVLIWCLFVTLCMSIVLISDFLLAPKWLIVEPKSPQSLKTIYQVLKFAAKHKAPIDRSALTYWEEDIPSRIDLGKSRYGGPFTTEQVEDVKTILRLLIISLSMWVLALSLSLGPNSGETHIYNGTFPGLSVCTTNILYSFTYNSWWCVIIVTLLFEFAIYPFIRNKLPSILRRIGIGSFLIIVMSCLCLILKVIHFFYTDESSLEWIAVILYTLMTGLLTQVLVTSVIEFVCAQSPYNMRGLFVGYVVFLVGATSTLGTIIRTVLEEYCHNYSPVVILSIKTVLGLIGFILHCILAHWYKRRERDDIYSPHILVEEVYDRYLTAQNNTGRHGNW